MATNTIIVQSKQNRVDINVGGAQIVQGDADGDFVAEAGSLTNYVNIKRAVDSVYVVKDIVYTAIKDSSGSQIGTSGANCVSVLNSTYFNPTTKIQSFDNVNFQNTIAAGQVLRFTDQSGSLRVDNVPLSDSMESSKTSPTTVGAFNAGARLLTGHASQAITAGNLVNMTGAGASNVGAQSANAAATGMLFIATDEADSDELLIEGVVKLSSTTTTSLMATNAKVGTPLYMSTTAGAVQTAAPSTSGDIVRVVGYVMNATDRVIYFNPSVDWIEL